jgi:hypothetical protein
MLKLYEARQRQHDLLKSGSPVGPRTYEVDINADPAHMLDWDKGLAQQSDVVRQNLSAARDRLLTGDYQYGAVRGEGGFHPRIDSSSGQKIYRDVVLPTRDEATAAGRERLLETVMRPKTMEESLRLREAGIPGIKYLDEGSRVLSADLASTKGRHAVMPSEGLEREIARLQQIPLTSNYVIFDPERIRIMKKYGIAGAAPAGMGALAAQDQYRE